MRRARLVLVLAAAACAGLVAGCGPAGPTTPTPPPPAKAPAWSLDASGLHLGGAQVSVSGLVPEVLLGTGAVPVEAGTVTGPVAGTDALGPYRETELATTVSGISVEVALRDRGAGVATVRLTATRAGGADPGLSGFGLGPATVTGPAFEDVLVEGYQSWSATYDGAIEALGTDTEASLADVGDDGDDLRVDDRVSWWISDLHGRGADLLLGAVTADRFKTRVLTWTGRDGRVRVHLLSGGSAPPIPFPAGTPERSERFLLIARPGTAAGLATWARDVAAWQPPVAPPFLPVGWNSWNTLFATVTGPEVLANAEALRAIPGLAPDDAQIDDGWERGWGDWTANQKFPGGLGPVAAALAHQGLHPGVWMAPFLAAPTSPVMVAHPGWALVAPNGRPRIYQSSGGPMDVLDTSIPAAEDWVVGQVKARLDEGFRYLKLDYLFAGAMAGKRAAGVTGVSAYRHTMARILAAAKAAGAYVLACGAPLLPTAGVAHGIRVSADISLAKVDYAFALVKNALRNVAYRGFVNAFLAVDPDAPRLAGLSADGQRTVLTAALLAGRIFAVGDDLTTLDGPSRSRLAEAVSLPLLGTLRDGAEVGWGARPAPGTLLGHPIADPKSPVHFYLSTAYPVPDLWSAPLSGGGEAVAAFDLGDAEARRTVDLSRFGWRPGRTVTDAWAERPVTTHGGKVTVTLPAHGVVLWIVR